MSRPLFTNNAATNLAEPITPLSTVLQVTAGTGGYFPQPSIGDYFMLTLVQANNPAVSEIVECIGRSGDILTVVRGQEGTTPQTFNLSDNVELRITASSLNLFAIGGGSGGTASGTSVADFTATAGQTVFTLPWSYTQGIDNLAIFVNGSKQIVNVNFVETSSTSFTMASGLNVGDLVEAIYNLPLSGGVINSDNVTYNEGGTGAVNQTVQDKLQEFVSVKDFGAVGDGVADDTTAIQAAINAHSGIIYFPSGTYNISAPLRITTGIVLQGESKSTSIISKTTTTSGTGTALARAGTITDSYVNDAVIQLIHADNTYTYYAGIHDLTIQKSSYAASSYGIYAPRSSQCSYSNLLIKNVTTGYLTYDSWMYKMSQVTCQAVSIGYSHADDGSGSGTGTSGTFENCWVNFDNTIVTPSFGYFIFGLTYSNLISCGCDNGTPASGTAIVTAYFFGTCTGITVNGCGVENHQGQAVSVSGGSVIVNAMRTLSMTGNITGTAATVSTNTNATLTLNNCNFAAVTGASGTFYNYVIQNGATIFEINPALSPSGGASFISFSGGASLTQITGTSATRRNSTGTFNYQANLSSAAAPTTGTWAVGNIVYNSVPASAGYIGWVCTVAGTPGTWKTFGVIS